MQTTPTTPPTSSIQQSTAEDQPTIFQFYEGAAAYQRKQGCTVWLPFAPSLIDTEIQEGRQWKLLLNGKIACIWAITYSDPQIWGARNADPALYIHRLATHPDFRGQHLLSYVVTWARAYAQSKGKAFVRLDTVGPNPKLTDHYQRYGFELLGHFSLADTEGLPDHYQQATVCLLQMAVGGVPTAEKGSVPFPD